MSKDIISLRQEDLREYLKEIFNLYNQKNVTELSYYPALKEFLEKIIPNKNYKVIVNPSEEWGMPDFVVQEGEIIIGYIEAKTPDKDLVKVIAGDQVKRYLEAFPNVIVTNFIEFIFLQGEDIDPIEIKLCYEKDLLTPKIPRFKDDKISKFQDILTQFISFKSTPIKNINKLTYRLSRLTRVLKSILERYYDSKEDIFSEGSLNDLFEGFKTTLIDNIKAIEFCDVLAQTLCYSLLLAVEHQITNKEKKNLLDFKNAWAEIPKSLPVLIEIFTKFMVNMPKDVQICCNSIIQLLNNCELDRIFSFFGKKKEDPSIYFYEKFLAEYNPKLRKMRGIYFTPIPIVQFIVNSIDKLLQTSFKMDEGIMNKNVYLLDPCAGTLTFIIESIRLIYQKLEKSKNLGIFEAIIKDHVLKKFFAFEIMVAPYAIGHFKIREILKNLGVILKSKEAFGLFLTNTLETRVHKKIPGFTALTEEYEKANNIKIKSPILIIVGNPPYKIGSTNKTQLIQKLVKDYRPERLKKGEQENLEPLSDDYIKFIRFAQWKITEKNKEGIVGFITNNNFLRGRIHRQIRLSILESFDEVLIYDLHGDTREERPPKNKKNVSVFGIKTGVCIFFLIKYKNVDDKNNSKKKLAKVYYTDVWGTAKEKLDSLNDKNILDLIGKDGIKDDKFQIDPKKPYYLFYPYITTEEDQNKWDAFLTIRGDLFNEANLAVQTSRDSLVVSTKSEKLLIDFKKYKDSKLSTKELINRYKWNQWKGNDWAEKRIEKYLNNLKKETTLDKYIRIFHYRPFDFQHLFYFDGFVQVPARDRSEHLEGNESDEIALIVGRSGRPIPHPWDMALITSILPDALLVSSRGSSILCPLKHTIKGKLIFNLKLPFIKRFIKLYNLKEISIDNYNSKDFEKIGKPILFYLYAILYSTQYREKWEKFLDYDMPRFPFPKDYQLFLEMSKKGEEIAGVHLLKSDELSKIEASLKANFPQKGNNKIEKIKYLKSDQKIGINNIQYFENVDEEIWNFRIGGYQVLKQWLNRRKSQILTVNDINHFSILVAILKKTSQFMDEISPLYEKIEESCFESRNFRITLDDY